MNTSRKTARLSVSAASPGGRQASRQKTIASIVREAEKLTSVYETEYFVSSLLGQFWERRATAPPLETFDQDLILGAALAEGLGEHGGRGGRLVLHAIGRLVPGGLGALGTRLAGQVRAELPRWSAEIGRSRVTSATCAAEAGDGAAIVLEVEGIGMIDHGVAIFISERQGGIAKHLGLIYGGAQRGRAFEDEMGGQPLDVGEACRRVLDAISVTDRETDAPVGETFAGLRTIAIARAASVSSGRPPLAWAN